MVQSLSPEQQQLYNQDLRIRQGQGNISEGMMGNVASTYSQPANFASLLPEYDVSPDSPYRRKTEEATYNNMMRFMEPRLQEQERRQSERLISQGFNVKDQPYRQAMQYASEDANAQRAAAADRAILAGRDEAMQGGQFGLAQALQRINLGQGDRARLLNELNAFRTGQQVQVPGTATTAQTPGLPSTDILGAYGQDYSNRLGSYNAQQANQGNFLSGLMGLAGSAFPYIWGMG